MWLGLVPPDANVEFRVIRSSKGRNEQGRAIICKVLATPEKMLEDRESEGADLWDLK
jgi:hypothetical protein